jgi:hypothetical protein
MMLRALSFLALVAAACDQGPVTGVVLTVQSSGLTADQLRITANFDGQSVVRTTPNVPATRPLTLPTDLFAQFSAQSHSVTFVVEALWRAKTMAWSNVVVQIEPNQVLRASVALGPAAAPMPPPDLATTDLATALATNDLGHVSYSSVVLADSPIAYYRLDEPSGAMAHDSSGHGLDGTWGALVTRGAPGLIAEDSDAAATFNGGTWSAASIVTVPTSPLLQPTQAVSVELWMRQSVYNGDATPLLANGDWNMSQPAYGVVMFANAFGVLLNTATTGPVGGPGFLTVTKPALNTTYYFVETYDGQNVKMYVNGALQATKAASGSIVNYTNEGLGIGSVVTSAIGDAVFAGTLDEVAIYGTALTPQRIQAHYAAGLAMPSP